MHESKALSGSMKSLLIKASITIIIIFIIYEFIDFKQVYLTIFNANLPLLSLAFGLICVHLILVSERWRIILIGFGVNLSRFSFVKIVFVGQFFKQILPSSILSELVKIVLCKKIGIRLAVAATSSIIDKAAGLITLWLIVIILTSLFNNSSASLSVLLAFGSVVIGFCFVATFSLNAVTRRYSNTFVQRRWLKLASLIKVFTEFRLELAEYVLLLVISIAANAAIFASVYIITKAVGVNLSLTDAILYIPLALVMSMIPISFGGWGVREVSFIYVFSLNSLPNTEAVATSAVYGLILTIVGLIGVFFIPSIKK